MTHPFNKGLEMLGLASFLKSGGDKLNKIFLNPRLSLSHFQQLCWLQTTWSDEESIKFNQMSCWENFNEFLSDNYGKELHFFL